ncbi:MAG: glycosyltransferase family 4 protein [Treponematales bacterium]
MKILFFIHSLTIGGAERILTELASDWAERHEVFILTYIKGDDFYTPSEKVKRIFLKHHYKSWHDIKGIVKFVFEIRKTFVKINPDYIISFLLHPNLFALLAGAFLKKKIIVCERNIINDPEINRRLYFLRGVLYRHTYKITVQHEQICGELLRSYPRIPPEKVCVTPNPVKRFSPPDEPLAVRAYFNDFTDNDKLIIAVGRFTPVKAFRDVITVFSMAHSKNTHIKLAILGDGKEYHDCRELVKTLGLEDCVSLPGRIENMAPWYAAAALFVTASRYEGFPNALSESLAAGIPGVAFDVPSIAILLKDGVNGYVIKGRNMEMMARKILFLFDHPDVYHSMSREAQKISDVYSLENINKIWFEKVLT